MKALRKRTIWILLTLFLLPILAFAIWFYRQVRQNNLDRALIEAIKKEDRQKAIALLNEGADANAVDKPYVPITLWSVLHKFWNRSKATKKKTETEHYDAALYLAVYWYGKEGWTIFSPDIPHLVKALLEHGANPNVKAKYGYTPLMMACYFHHVEIVRYLLDYGADPNAKSDDNSTSVFDSCKWPDDNTLSCLHLLVEHGGNVNTTDNRGKTALNIYTETSSFDTSAEPLEYLSQLGLKVSVKDLGYAKYNKATKTIPFLQTALKKEQAEQRPAGTSTK